MEQVMNFGYLPEKYIGPEAAGIVIVPVMYDGTSTWTKGADQGPVAIVEASANMELYDIEMDIEVYKKGIFTDKAVEGLGFVEDVIKVVAERVSDYLERDKFVMVIGGEHSISIGSVIAQVENNKDITVLQLDAHCDLRDEYNGSKYNHTCFAARVKELCPVVQVGVRSIDSSEKKLVDENNIFFAKDIYNKKDWIKTVVSKLQGKVYITIDLDVFDPSIMPSTGTPEPGGLLWYDVVKLLKEVFAKKDVVGFDVVELCPDENNKSPDFLAAKLIYKMLSYKFGEHHKKEDIVEDIRKPREHKSFRLSKNC